MSEIKLASSWTDHGRIAIRSPGQDGEVAKNDLNDYHNVIS